MDELAVWEDFKRGSEKAFSQLYHFYAPLMLRYGHRLDSDRELVRDCLQQVFLGLWKNRASVGNPANVQNYLLKSMRHEVVRRATRTRQHETLPDNYSLQNEAPYEQVLIQLQSNETTQLRIADLLSRLPDRQREAIYLKYFANLKYDEMATIMEIDQTSVYKITYKAIARLQQLLHGAALP